MTPGISHLAAVDIIRNKKTKEKTKSIRKDKLNTERR